MAPESPKTFLFNSHIRHLRTQHLSAQPCPLPGCRAVLRNGTGLHSHVRSHHSQLSNITVKGKKTKRSEHKKYRCIDETCSSSASTSFATAAGFSRHMRQAHGNKRPFSCADCSGAYASSSALREHSFSRHRRKLDGRGAAKSLDCDVCGKSFGKRSLLVVHRYWGKCEICRNFRFSANSSFILQKGTARDGDEEASGVR